MICLECKNKLSKIISKACRLDTRDVLTHDKHNLSEDGKIISGIHPACYYYDYWFECPYCGTPLELN